MFDGQRVKILRLQHGMRQNELADKLYIGKSTLSNIEHNTRMPSLIILEKLCDIFQVPADYFLCRDYSDNDILSVAGLTKRQVDAVKAIIESYRLED